MTDRTQGCGRVIVAEARWPALASHHASFSMPDSEWLHYAGWTGWRTKDGTKQQIELHRCQASNRSESRTGKRHDWPASKKKASPNFPISIFHLFQPWKDPPDELLHPQTHPSFDALVQAKPRPGNRALSLAFFVHVPGTAI
ncbi:hypothetical protein An11g04560 [Aspergillus niger]|uniref:Uncharacterized protein n=2 Tax=Aspergillus niger TaxID=5061 RepID=A2QWB5_ASPNC|nr:hypothetical protein An11g04560 [Aspergillus niger]CAK45943.1 hypothetical protein An11g04560 [Aspergillus niger]